jgi:hypothetical protein
MLGGWFGDACGVSSEDAPKVVSMMHRQLRELPSAAEGFSRVVEVQLDAQHAAVVRTLTALPATDTLASGCPTPTKPKVRSFPTHGQLSAAQGSSTAVSPRTDNCPQPKEARPLSHALTSDESQHFDGSWFGAEVSLYWYFLIHLSSLRHRMAESSAATALRRRCMVRRCQPHEHH